MSGSDNYADGGVHTLTMGSSELNGILSTAARRNQLVLVDFSASWCGPCRMMLPVLHQLASEHRGRLAVVKVDCEQTAANQALAQASGIRGFPTFHLYRSQRKVAEKVGADQAGLRRAIQEQLAQLGPATGASGSGSGRGPMATSLVTALGRVKAGCTYDEFVAAAKTLLLFVGNVIDHPGEEKYRRVKASNPGFHSKLGCRAGGKECMAAIGFREMMEAGEAVLVMTEVPDELPRVRQLLEQALQSAEAAAASAAAAQRRAAAAGAAAAQAQAQAPPAAAAAPAPPAAAVAPPTAAAAPMGAPAAAAGAGSAPGGAPSSNVDASALARALAAALSTGGGTGAGGPGAGGGARAPVAAQGASGRPRMIRLSARGLARMLEQAMTQAGIGVAAAQQQQQPGASGNPPPPPAPPSSQ